MSDGTGLSCVMVKVSLRSVAKLRTMTKQSRAKIWQRHSAVVFLEPERVKDVLHLL